MSLSPELREQVRQRAKCACEFCSVSETDVGGLLTIDHFQPQSKGGSDDQDNLIYSCVCCNQYKRRRRQRAEEIRLLERYRDLVQLLSQVNGQLSELVLEQQQLLQEQRDLLRILLERQD